MEALVRLVERSATPASLPLREALFGGADAATVSTLVSELVETWMGPVAGPLFLRSGVGLVVGFALVDGREVVLKVHRWNVSTARLAAVQAVQAGLVARGLPAPAPLVPPTPLARGFATVEELRRGDPADGHSARVRECMAEGLADFIGAASSIEPTPDVGGSALRPSDQLWGEPHDPRFDFEATASGAEWIDELAQHARAVLSQVQLPDVVAHLDWRVENLAFADGALVAIYDWDSVGLAPEAVAVGQAAAQFSTDWGIGMSSLPTVTEMRAFVSAYESHRGRRFEDAERAALDAANLMLCAYAARCQHSDRVQYPEMFEPSGGGWARLLRERSHAALV